MRRIQRQTNSDKGSPKWMVTFSDMMTLILVFFILLFSMSVVDASKFQAIADSFQDRSPFDFNPSIIPFENPAEDRVQKPDPFERDNSSFQDFLDSESEQSEQLDELLLEVLEFLQARNLMDSVNAFRDERGVVLVLQEQVLFRSASAEVIDAAIPFLDKVGSLLEAIPNIVKVEGHTDSRPINTHQFPSNWELSGARSSSVIRHLIDNNNLRPERFISVGYGETRPVAPNTTYENLQKNRRVVIIISDPTYVEGELY
ncbi:flagellar motor protein MotS [Evansella sp. AB-P1]|uniref:flagellar motor protein MotS n=1 Tax=Evansella sp. AB-P1 TaxID=3037653 RepID=UPI00241D6D1E|nr:flagellar motor protein MotS [Evansella sp. AB-P1]MDG5787028.1 flagellar motor protein MotS [Evansella sp. AB-P1]